MTSVTAVRSSGRTGASRGAVLPLALVGPTASGKTEASLELARRLNAEIVVVDSMTVYRGMDLGTAKPSPEDRAAVPHHLLDVADPAEGFSVARFQGLAQAELEAIAARGRRALLVGGSGLYFRAVVDDLELPGTDPSLRRLLEAEGAARGPSTLHRRLVHADPEAAAKIDPENLRRSVRALEVMAITGRRFSSFATAWERYPPDRVTATGIRVPPDALRARIEARARKMFDGGLREEVERLLDRGFGGFLTATQAIGYLEMVEHVRGRLSGREALERTIRRTRGLARRQMAWFRRDPRIRWLDAPGGAAAIVDDIEEQLA